MRRHAEISRQHWASRYRIGVIRRRTSNSLFAGLVSLIAFWQISGCERRVPYHPDDSAVLKVEHVDIDQTLEIAAYRFDNLRKYQSLGLWIMRDQTITSAQAERVAELYFLHVDELRDEFDVWHSTWAIRNLYDGGAPSVKAALEDAVLDARRRARRQGGIADRMVNSEKVFYGDYHGLARAARRKMLVVPGNRRYVQSASDYRDNADYERRAARVDAQDERRRLRRGEAPAPSDEQLQRHFVPEGGIEELED